MMRRASIVAVAMIRFRLEELLKARGWSDYRLAQESGVGANVIGKYRKNQVKEPSLYVMNLLCAALGCGIGELMEYVPDKGARKASSRRKK